MFNYDWTLKDANFAKNKGKVFSCFSCGGGSTMGYKLVGFDVIGCNEIDPRMMNVYKKNHNPKYNYLEPIQDFKNRGDLPEELYNLDILDGSPPCSSFSMAGSRERAWGKEKKFREGQSNQVLDTLFFDFIDVAKKLQPKVIIAENVKGLLAGEAKKYLHKIIELFTAAGYYAQYFLLDASKMGVPQKRERVFFICLRMDIAEKFLCQANLFEKMPKIDLDFTSPEILFNEISDNTDRDEKIANSVKDLWHLMGENHGGLSFVHPKGSFFNEVKVGEKVVCPTLTSRGKLYHYSIPRCLNQKEICKISSFPSDYDFGNEKPAYVCGMSVPPLMAAKIAEQVWLQWLSRIDK